MSRGTAAQLEDCRRRLVRETIALVYGDGDPERQERLLRECKRLARMHRPKRRRRRDPMAWKVLAPPEPLRTRPAMSLSASGGLKWTEAMQREMGEPSHVNVLYDDETNRLGVRPAEGENGLQVRVGNRVAIKLLLLAAGVWEGLQLPIQLTKAVPDQERTEIWAISLAGQEAEA